jgi:hypothetical protein
MADWKKFSEAWPDWKDSGRRIEIERQDGTRTAGVLYVEDFFALDDGDEVPVWCVRDESGGEHSFVENERWRFLD